MGTQPSDRESNQTSGGRPLATVLAVTGGLIRLIPHPWNLALGGLGLFAGARLKSWRAYAVALGIRFGTDTFLLIVHGVTTGSTWLYFSFLPFVYLSLALNVLLGRLLQRTESPWRISALTLVASVQFFLLTNFGTWLMTPMYPHTLTGLWDCYLLGLAFFPNTLISDFLYAGGLFGAHAWLSRLVFHSERVVEGVKA
jgi:hypothetical protein